MGDKVYLINYSGGPREGPYLIASLPSSGKCILSLENDKLVRNGEEIDTEYVDAA